MKKKLRCWTVYLVRCRDGSLYTGITVDLKSRLEKHNAGTGAKYTRSRRPVKLVWHRAMKSGRAARQLEVEIKSWTKEKKEQMIRLS